MAEKNYSRLQCTHEKPLFANGNQRLSCFSCSPKPVAAERKKYEFKSKTDCQCLACGGKFLKSVAHNKYCSDICRHKTNNKATNIKRVDRTERPCRCCGVLFTPGYGVSNKLQCSTECRIAYRSNLTYKALRKRIASKPTEKLTRSIRTFICQSILRGGYKKKSRTHEILGCDFGFFKAHVERQFHKGMTWDNRSKWHIDHIIPMASAKTEGDVIALNHFTNLRPIWAKDNISKGAQITHLI